MYPQAENSSLVGFCIGVFAAAAIGCTQSLSELLPVAIQAVVLSFKAGQLALDISQRFCTTSDQPGQSWAFRVHGLSTDRVTTKIHEFSESKVCGFDYNFY